MSASSPPQHVPFGTLRPQHDSADKRKYVYDTFNQCLIPFPLVVSDSSLASTTPSLPLGGDNEVLALWTGAQSIYQINIAAQTIKFPTLAAGGLDISQDLTDNDGWEKIFSADPVLTGGKHAWTIGTDKPFFAKCTISMADVSGTDEFLFGFRKQEACAVAYTTYTDYFAIGLVTAAATGVIKTVSRINTGTAVITDTLNTWADAATKTFEIRVNMDGKAIALINGAIPTVNYTSHTFDAGDIVVPFMHRVYATTTPGAELLSLYEGGVQNWIGNNPKG